MGRFVEYVKKAWAENQAYYTQNEVEPGQRERTDSDLDGYDVPDRYERYIQEQREKIRHENEFLGLKNKRYKKFDKSTFDPVFGYQNWNDVPIISGADLDGFLRREMDEYLILLERLEVQYSVLCGLKEFFGRCADQFICSCLEAAQYALMYKTYHQVITISRRNDPVIPAAIPLRIPQFFPYVKLAIVFEKRGEYGKAIEVCSKAIAMGLLEDGTKGKMPGRMSRLISKQRKVQGK